MCRDSEKLCVGCNEIIAPADPEAFEEKGNLFHNKRCQDQFERREYSIYLYRQNVEARHFPRPAERR